MKLGPAIVIFVVGVGMGVGIGMLSTSQPTHDEELTRALEEVERLRGELDGLKRQALYSAVAKPGNAPRSLDEQKIANFRSQMGQYVTSLRARKFVGVAEAFGWFGTRWVEVLGAYGGDEARRARADVLAQLLVSVRSSIDPSDFITWQVEWLRSPWLPEVQVDVDADGWPKRRRDRAEPLQLDSTTVCRAAMEMNLLVRDASIMVDHNLPCNAGDQRLSGVLKGKTHNALLDSFVRWIRQYGYVVVDKTQGRTRSILVGMKR